MRLNRASDACPAKLRSIRQQYRKEDPRTPRLNRPRMHYDEFGFDSPNPASCPFDSSPCGERHTTPQCITRTPAPLHRIGAHVHPDGAEGAISRGAAGPNVISNMCATHRRSDDRFSSVKSITSLSANVLCLGLGGGAHGV